MRIHDTSQQNLNLKNQRSLQVEAKKGQTPKAPETAGSGTQSDQPLRPMRTYKSHGMLEQYPANLTLAYVSGHENRHAQKNRRDAGAEAGKIKQDISYNVRISPDGKLMATGGVTTSRSSSHGSSVEKHDHGAMNNAPLKEKTDTLSPETSKKRIKEFHLSRKRESLERELRNKTGNTANGKGLNYSDFSEKANHPLSDFSDKKSNAISENIEKIHIRRKISQVESEKEQISRSEELKKSIDNETPQPETDNPKTSELSIAAPPKEEHVDLSGVAPAAYYFAKRQIPNTVLTNGFGSAFEINNILNRSERFRSNKTIPESITLNRKSIRQQIGALSTIAVKLNDVRTASAELGSSRSFNTRTAKSSSTKAVAAETSAGSPLGNFQVSVNTRALPHKIVSDQYSDPFAALGFSGSFKINGYQVDVETTDSLNSIKDKINYGEDINKNGKLDFSEDLNGNGSVDSFAFTPTTISNSGDYIFEDVDFDGVLNASEDVDGNEFLDGGTAQLGVRADIQFDRLTIRTVKTGNHRLTVDDTDGILRDLGLLYENTDGKTRETAQFDSDNEQLNSSPSMAQFSINSLNFKRSSNEVRDIIPNTNLKLKEITDKTVTLKIKSNIKAAKEKIENFSEDFNASMKTLNNLLAFQKTLQTNAIVQNIRTQIVDQVNKPVESLTEKMNSLQSIGLESINKEKHAVSSFAMENVAQSVFTNKKAVSSYRAQGDESIYSMLKRSGIQFTDDDTLRVNNKNLSSALSNSPLDVSKVYTTKGHGISDRMEKLLDDILDKQGTLDLEKRRLNAYGGNLAKAPKIAKDPAARQSINISAFV